MLKDLFPKKKRYATVASNTSARDKVPEGLMEKCKQCGQILFAKELEKQVKTCPHCGYHFTLSAPERIQLTLDEGSFVEFDDDLLSGDPLHFPDYPARVERSRQATGLTDAVLTGTGTIIGYKVVIAAMDSRFIMGSMGSVVGEKLTRAIEQAIADAAPMIIFSVSGGARMQEGIFSLMQMAKVSTALARLDALGLLYISVLTHPTTGGVTASFAMQGDVNLAEPGATIGFAGRRIIEQTIRQKLPDEFQTAEFVMEHGMIDQVVHRKDLRAVLGTLVSLHDKGENGVAVELPFEKPLIELRLKIEELKRFTEEKGIDMSAEVLTLETKAKALAEAIYRDLTPWQKVQIARHPERPTTLDYIRGMCDDFIELHGDRSFRDDAAIVGGIGRLEGMAVTLIGTQKGRDTKENIFRNFGMAHPEGYRKALRLMKQAEKFGRPIVTFIDTAGAYPGAAAEERGQGEAIARNLIEMAALTVPVVCVVTGEGGSGGALGLGVGDKILMLEHAYYSVIAPESAAALLWKDATQGQRAADAMCITAQDLSRFGIVDEILLEPFGGAQREPLTMIATVKDAVWRALVELHQVPFKDLPSSRYEKYRKMGVYTEVKKTRVAEEVATVEAIEEDVTLQNLSS